MTIVRTATGLVFADDFNRANGAPGANYTITSGTWNIVSNKLKSLSGGGQIEVTAAGLIKKVHIQVKINKLTTLGDYAIIVARVNPAGTTLMLFDVGSSTDGTDPNKTRIYKQVAGVYTRLAGGQAPAGWASGTEFRLTYSCFTGAHSGWVNGAAQTTTNDATAANDIAGKVILSHASQAPNTDITWEDLVVCTDRLLTIRGLPTGWKIRANGLTSGAAVAGTDLTLDLAGTALPAAAIEVLDGGGATIDTLTTSIYGGDVFAFENIQETMGGHQLAATGTMGQTATIADQMGGHQVAVTGLQSMLAVINLSLGGPSIEGVIGHFEDNPYPLGRREITEDFVGPRSPNISILKRPDAISFDYLTAFSMGPQAIGDASGGATNRPWYVRADNGTKSVWLCKANDTNTAWNAETLLFHFTGVDIEEIDLAFDQSGNSVVCLERKSGALAAKEVWLYWFKPSAGAFVLEVVEAGRTPRILLDNPPDPTNSDIILFYLKPGVGLVYRVQRELYTPAHTTPHLTETDWYIEDAFYTKGYRVAVFMVQHNVGGTYGSKRLETTLMPVFIASEKLTMVGFIRADGTMPRVLIIFTDDPAYDLTKAGNMLKEYFTMSGSFTAAATLAGNVLFHTLYDVDSFSLSGGIADAGALTDSGITFLAHDLYDTDGFSLSGGISAAGTLAGSVIFYTMYDLEEYTFTGSFGSGGTLA